MRLADGHDAWVVLSHDAARQALNDPRSSKDMIAALGADPDVVDEGLPGAEYSRHMLHVDPPDHTRLRRLDRLNDQELLSSLFQLIVAGHDTTTAHIGAVVVLLDHPEQLGALLADLDLMPAAVEELLRYSALVPHATFRETIAPIAIGGTEIPDRQQVLVCLAAANRDPAAHPDPESSTWTAEPTAPGVGPGIHFCLGAPLARLEARIAFTTLLLRFPDLRLAVPRTDLRWTRNDGLVFRGLDVLPVTLGVQRILDDA